MNMLKDLAMEAAGRMRKAAGALLFSCAGPGMQGDGLGSLHFT
jgi:small ligand-binding sensory domain FIST